MTANTNEDSTAAPALEALTARLAAMEKQLTSTQRALDELLAHARGQQDFIDEMRPVAASMMRASSSILGELEAKGHLDFARASLGLLDRVASGYSSEDVAALGDSIIAILDTVRAVTQPEVLALIQEGAEALEEAEDAEPIGVIGLARASSDTNVQKGLGILVAALRHVGRAGRVLNKKKAQLRKGEPGEPAVQRQSAMPPSPTV